MTEARQIDLSIPYAFRELFQPKRYKVYYGGRGGAKSWAYADALLIMGIIQPLRVLCAREIQNSIADSVHKLLVDRIVALGLQDYYLIQEKGIYGSNGTEFFYRGLYRNVRGLKSTEAIDICWVEEGENVTDNSWELLIPTMRKKGSEIWVSFNPRNPTDATWRRFVMHPKSNAIVKKVSWRDNPYFNDTELPAERLSLMQTDREAYDHIWEGEFDTRFFGGVYSKQLAKAQAAGRFKSGLYDDKLPVMTAWDLGYDDATAIWFWQRSGTEIRLVDYYENNGQDIAHYVDVLKARPYKYGKHFVPHDAANKLLAAGGRSIVQQAYALGVKMYVVAATSQQNGIEALRKTLGICWFDPDACVDGIDACMQYQFEYDDDKQTFKSTPLHNWASHAADALEIIGQVWRNEVQEKEVEKPRFLSEATANELFWPKKTRIRPERI